MTIERIESLERVLTTITPEEFWKADSSHRELLRKVFSLSKIVLKQNHSQSDLESFRFRLAQAVRELEVGARFNKHLTNDYTACLSGLFRIVSESMPDMPEEEHNAKGPIFRSSLRVLERDLEPL